MNPSDGIVDNLATVMPTRKADIRIDSIRADPIQRWVDEFVQASGA